MPEQQAEPQEIVIDGRAIPVPELSKHQIALINTVKSLDEELGKARGEVARKEIAREAVYSKLVESLPKRKRGRPRKPQNPVVEVNGKG